MGDATPLTGAAVVARLPAVVVLGQDGRPADGEVPLAAERRLQLFPDMPLGAVERHRRQELAVRELGKAEPLAAHPDEALDVAVPGGDVGVPDRPVGAVAVAEVGGEVEVAPAVHLPAPHDRAPAHLAPANPAERLRRIGGVGVVEVVHEELAAPLVAGVAVLLHRLLARQLLPVAVAPEMELPGRYVLHVVLCGVDRPARLEHQRVESAFGQLLGGPATADAGANHDRVIGLRHQSPPGRAAGRCSQPSKRPGMAGRSSSWREPTAEL